MNRRTFVRSLSASFAAKLLPFRARSSKRLNRVGLELYSVRDEMKRDPEGTLAAVRAAGYDDVELLWSFNNFGRTAEQVRASLARTGLRAPSAHIDPKILLNDWQRSLDTAALLGHQYLIVPSFPSSVNTLDAWRTWADRFNTAGAAARRSNLWLAFHNEAEHMKPIDGQVPYDVFVERTDPSVVRLQLDVGNMAMGGGDPKRYLERYKDRYWSFHIKDVLADRSRDTDLGTGVLDLRGILAAIPAIDQKIVYVEHESAPDQLAAARRDWQYLAKLDF
jgi:sugar phosphate isomerase/epimerase